MYYLKKFECIEYLSVELEQCIYYDNNHLIKQKLKGLSSEKLKSLDLDDRVL
ncbi:hypothetical protein PAU_01371 [Photorhabdus asymbiotica]|uniref:Uncharacterized protein n=1 Tax=Photorhabdus asymbiotica subsp. asymbiotica (strain ATCC 43949 / 3105-77) TaxID=553480 RepID=C7BSG0_PHOAA|nr:hypothetical protein PAU_01371 [Photorhabdus asymbiotica]